MLNKLVLPLLLTASTCAFGQSLPKDFAIPEDTLSPDKHFGVTVPDVDNSPDDARNSLVDACTGHVLTVIQTANVGYNRMNHGGILPSRWSSDGSVLVWQVDGKWSDRVLVVVKLQGSKVAWQLQPIEAWRKTHSGSDETGRAEEVCQGQKNERRDGRDRPSSSGRCR